jgi:P27 family predicted phage terminase small subunit
MTTSNGSKGVRAPDASHGLGESDGGRFSIAGRRSAMLAKSMAGRPQVGGTTAEHRSLVPVDRLQPCGDQIGEIVHDQVVRGRKPMPPELKVVSGMRHDRVNERAPIPDEGRAKPPRGLSPPQRRIFRLVVDELARMGVRCGPDTLIIESLAGMVDWKRRASAKLELGGAWGPGARGGEVATPAWRVFRDANREIARLSAELGLSPTARNRVMTGPEPASDLERLLS